MPRGHSRVVNWPDMAKSETQELKRTLPRLLYVGDVPVAQTTAGSLLLFRLLRDYPSDKLMVAEGLAKSGIGTRLPGISYGAFSVAWGRLLRTRFHRLYGLWVHLRANGRVDALSHLAITHRAQVVLTVVHNFSWVTAAALARKLKLPLLLIVHDDPWFHAECPAVARSWFEQRLRSVCRQASTCLCVSPNMAEWVRATYGARTALLYPSWDSDAHLIVRATDSHVEGGRPFTIAYAGNVFFEGYRSLLSKLARCCEALGFRLVLFSNIPEVRRTELGLESASISLNPLVLPAELASQLGRCADALFVPMSFGACDRRNMQLSFPSKLCEYTHFGLPLLIWGPSDCSAVRWARENAGVAEVVEEQDVSLLGEALRRLAASSRYRQELGSAAINVGSRLFSHSQVTSIFYNELRHACDSQR